MHVTAPYAIVVENVPEFRTWGPVGCPDGRLYRHWLQGLELLGDEVEEHVLTATDFGVPQRRQRLFLVATMGRFGKLGFQAPRAAQEPAFGPCIDWDADARWMRVADASQAIQGRIAKGRRNHGRRFLTQHVTGHPGVGLDEPIRTITTKSQWNVVDGDRYRGLTVREHARGMGFPDDYAWPSGASKSDCIKGLGNAVCPPIATALVRALDSHLSLGRAAA
jgi:DNA (cytosine-5)-methyltransferase 1